MKERICRGNAQGIFLTRNNIVAYAAAV